MCGLGSIRVHDEASAMLRLHEAEMGRDLNADIDFGAAEGPTLDGEGYCSPPSFTKANFRTQPPAS